MTYRIYAKHEPYNTGHLAEVFSEMGIVGAPTIKVIEYEGEYFATVGSHRLACAFEKNEIPNIIVEEKDFEGGTNLFWNKVKLMLPFYDFEHINLLEAKIFKQTNG